MNEVHIAKVSNGYIVRNVAWGSPENMRVCTKADTWVFEDLENLYDWMEKNFNAKSDPK